jgi:UPF0755 protein
MADRGTQTPLPPDYTDPPVEPRRRSFGGILVGLLAAGLLLVGVVIGGRAAADFFSGLTAGPTDVTAPDVEPGQPVAVDIPQGSSARTIGELLAGAGVVDSSLDFEVSVRAGGVGDALKAGEYEMTTGMSSSEAIDILIEGPDAETYRLTVREGLRMGEVLDEIADQTPFTAGQLERTLMSGEVISAFVSDDAESIQAWEGALFPDTYEFFTDATAAEVLQRLADELERRIGSIDWSVLSQRGMSIYDGLIMASLVEAETRVDGDRPQVASVLYNRLELGIALQIDATVLYAMDARGIGLTLDDLETDSPYNTYQVPGLPPTPIGTVGMASLEAVADPAETDFLYYVLTSTDGTHTFTADYDEFLRFKAQAKEDGVIP